MITLEKAIKELSKMRGIQRGEGRLRRITALTVAIGAMEWRKYVTTLHGFENLKPLPGEAEE